MSCIISLFYLGQWNMTAFVQWAHLYIWQALIMLDVLIVWLIWVRRINRCRASRRAAVRRWRCQRRNSPDS